MSGISLAQSASNDVAAHENVNKRFSRSLFVAQCREIENGARRTALTEARANDVRGKCDAASVSLFISRTFHSTDEVNLEKFRIRFRSTLNAGEDLRERLADIRVFCEFSIEDGGEKSSISIGLTSIQL